MAVTQGKTISKKPVGGFLTEYTWISFGTSSDTTASVPTSLTTVFAASFIPVGAPDGVVYLNHASQLAVYQDGKAITVPATGLLDVRRAAVAKDDGTAGTLNTSMQGFLRVEGTS